VILASLGHEQFKKSLIFVANLRGQPRKSAILGAFPHFPGGRCAIFRGKSLLLGAGARHTRGRPGALQARS
jgi:hypothetical protein